MSLSQFSCPHCSSPFQVDTSLPSLQVACPHCRQPVALTSEPPAVDPVSAQPAATEPPIVEPPPAAAPVSGSHGYSPADLLPPSFANQPEEPLSAQSESSDPVTEDYRSRQLMAGERASRKFVKNMIVWVCCAIVLTSILAFFVMRGGS
ncbi:MAG: hypothetical protein H8E66_10870 [Planctomycetes bacterium]|nr:hypothetical protein [Planctomycetota bacterium]